MSTEVLKTKKSIRGLSARVAGAGKLPAPLKLQSTASETVPSIALPSPSLPSPSFSLSFASFGYDGPSSSLNNTGSTTPNLSFPTTPEPLFHPTPKPNIPITNSENIVPSSPRTRAAKLLGIGFPSSSSASKEEGARSTKEEDELPPKRPGTFRTRSTSFHALSSSFRSNSNSNTPPPPSPSIPTSTPLSTSFTPSDILPSSPSSSTWTHRLSVKLRPRKSVPNLRAQSPPPPPLPSQPLFSSHPRTRSSSASPKGSAAPLSPLPPPKDPFAPPTPPPAPRQRSTSFAGAAATNGMMSVGGGLKSPRLSPSMLDLALEARGLIQLEGRARKASEGGGGPVAVVSSSSGFATPSTLGSVPPSPLSISQNSTTTTASSAASTYRTGSSTSGSSSRQVSESPKPLSAVVYSPSSPVPTSPLPPLPTDADWRPPFSPQLPSSPTTTTTKEDLKGLGVGTIGASGGGGEGRGRRGWNSGEGQGAGGDGFGGAGGRGEMPSGPNRPRRVDDGSNPNGGGGPTRDGDDGRRDDRRIDRTTVEDDSDSDDSSSSSSSSSSDDEDATSRRPPAVTSPRVEADSDDDVPLAVAHPAALSVQKSLRLSRRKEKHERKLREKKLERGNRSPPSRRRDAPPTSNSNSTTTASGTDPHGHHSRREAERREREPKKELPSAYGAGQEGVFVAEELERKLLAHLNEGVGSTSTARTRKASSSGTKSRGEGNGAYGYEESGGNSRAGEASTTARSRMMEKSRTLPLPPPPPPMDLSTRPTAATSTSSFGAMNLGRAKSQSTQPSASSSLRTRGASNQPFPSSSTNASHDRPLMRRRPSEPAPAPSPPMPPPLPASTNFPLPPPRLTRPSLPHLLSSSSSPHSPNRPSPPKSPVPAVMPTETTRMFLEKMGGRAVEVEVGNATTAGMVLEGLRRKGELGGREGEEMMNGGWSVWEGGNDWGIERPLREYELLSEVSSSWNNETRLNAFIIKRCKISSLLTLQAIPNQPPNIIGWVQMEVKKGSWKKRFLEIREGSVWICKNDRGKDETFLCSMSAYDVYSFTRPYKAPKGRVWGLKSQDKIQFFEEPKDYIHIFTSSDERTWETMWRGITSARSYALTLSNPALFRTHLALQHSLSAHHPHSHAHSVNSNNNSLHHSSPKPNNNQGVTSPTMGSAPNPLINPASLEFGAVGTGVGVGGIGGGGAVHGLGVLGGIGAIGNKGLFEKGSLLGKMHG